MNLNEDPVLAFSLGSSPRNSVTNCTCSSFQGAAHTTSASELAAKSPSLNSQLLFFLFSSTCNTDAEELSLFSVFGSL